MDICQTKKRKINPKERANILSRITFFYTSALFWRTYNKGKIEENDLYDVPKNCQAEILGTELEKHIRRDLAKHGAISIYKILWSCFGIEYLSIGIIQLVIRTTVIITIPMTLSKLVLYFQSGQTELTKKDAIILGSLLILLNLMNITYLHNYLLRLAEVGIRVKTAFSSVIYRKCLKLTSSDLSEITIGKIVTLMTKDVTTLESMVFYGNDTWIGVTQSILVCCLIYYKMGPIAFSGIGFLILALPVQIYIGKVISKLKEYSLEYTDERLQTTKEIITAIQFIKMYTWEAFFEEKISRTRKQEMTSILKIFLASTLSMLLGALTSKIAFYALLMTCIWFDQSLSADIIYYVMTLFLRIRHALNTAIPKGILMAGELTAAVARIESLLNMDEIQETSLSRNQNEPKLDLKNLTITSGREIILKNTTLCIRSGLTVLTGPTGCGKTSLLKSFLGENTITDGELNIFGSMSYASQEPWIFPSSLKRNIIFGEYFDSSRYEKVLEVCALNLDLDQFQFGDEMRIADNGSNLSKGQKARVNLARAVYKNADIYLLDDCFTSLDASVRKFVFENCIKTFLRDKICIIVTQQLEILGEGDRILFMENGIIKLENDIAAKDNIKVSSHTHVASKRGEINNNVAENTDISHQETTKLLQSNPSSPSEGIYSEQTESGKVSWNIYQKYIQYGGGYIILFSVLACFICKHFSNGCAEKILSSWINENNEVSHKNMTKSSSSSFSSVYSILILTTIITAFLTSWVFFSFTKRASLGLHSSMANSIIHASMRFFDNNLIGNILNRFSKDLTVIDEQFPIIVFEFLEILFGFMGMVVLISTVNIIFLLPTVIILIAMVLLKIFYMPTGRSLQRLDLSTRSPVIGYLDSSLEGSVTIRAFNAQSVLSQEFDRHLDIYTSANYSSKCCQRAFGYALDICCTLFVALIIAIFLSIDTGVSVGDVGLGITQAFTLSGVVQYGMRQWAELQTKVTSVERVMEYTKTEREENLGKVVPGAQWPEDCSIEYENVNFTYADGQIWTLKNINLSIRAKEKIGIIGRSGAGKSSIISALFRLYSYEGKIKVGKVDIQTIPLTFFRSKIAIIPQDPTLFTGTIRTNIDPLQEHTDEAIWRAIEAVGLRSLIPSLSATTTASYSAGQKQLLCLARALVSENRIIVMDEATSELDSDSVVIIDEVIAENFRECTVVLIAHRMQSVLGCDRVMVVQAGEIVQFDSPKVLARNEDGLFHEFLEKAGLQDMFD